ncbi:hypothetical protein V9K99_20435 [Kribbella sp. CCNWLW201]
MSSRYGDARTLLVSSTGIGVAFTLQALTGPGWQVSWFVVATLLAGFCMIVSYILQVSARQRVCPPELQGRVSATMSFVGWGAAPLGSLFAEYSAPSSDCTPPCGSPAWRRSPAQLSSTSPRSAPCGQFPPYHRRGPHPSPTPPLKPPRRAPPPTTEATAPRPSPRH